MENADVDGLWELKIAASRFEILRVGMKLDEKRDLILEVVTDRSVKTGVDKNAAGVKLEASVSFESEKEEGKKEFDVDADLIEELPNLYDIIVCSVKVAGL